MRIKEDVSKSDTTGREAITGGRQLVHEGNIEALKLAPYTCK
jgi:hypothetical protein